MGVGSGIRDPEKPIPDPGVNKVPDLGSATLGTTSGGLCRCLPWSEYHDITLNYTKWGKMKTSD
jgi:hypothetical protein